MKIGIDITSVEVNPAGIGQYTINLLNALLKSDSVNEYYIYSTKAFATEQSNIIIPRRKSLPFKGVFWMLDVARHAKKNRVNIFISPANFLFSILHPKTIQFIYDLGPVLYPQFFTRKAALFYKLLTKFILPRAWKIATISQTVKNELISFTGMSAQKIALIYPSINEQIFAVGEDYPNPDLPKQYLLSIGTLEPRKNLVAALTGFKQYLTDYNDKITKLVIVGKKGWFFDAIFQKVKELNLQNNVIFLGYVEDKFIASILKKAKGFIYLSLYEGFGMPVLESLYAGLPTIINDIPVFREFFVNDAILVNAQNTQQVAAAINKVINASVKADFDKSRFSWDKSAHTLLNLFDS